MGNQCYACGHWPEPDAGKVDVLDELLCYRLSAPRRRLFSYAIGLWESYSAAKIADLKLYGIGYAREWAPVRTTIEMLSGF